MSSDAKGRTSGRIRAALRFDKRATAGAFVLLLLAVMALAAPLLAPDGPSASDVQLLAEPSYAHPLGTDGQGQDVFAQFVWGARSSLLMAVVVGTGTTVLAVAVGLLAAYWRGLGDDAISLVVNIVLTIPGLPLIIVLAAFLPPGTGTIMLVLTVTGWAYGARVIRSQALTLRERDFVAASTVVGERPLRTVFVEILPNMWSVIVAFFVGQVVFALTAGSALEFLGLGDAGTASWGTMLYWAQNDSALLQGAWWTFTAPGLAIAATAGGLTLVNFAIDRAANPRLRSRSRIRRVAGAPTPVVRDAR
ncbi:ABC transporter permease [Streptomyces sp. bgisy091]|uniref:ABC transporter permease n=1 Tax=Streptomyces sp. bgisy091 TaxID=3413778 RepID=UPI003D72E87A